MKIKRILIDLDDVLNQFTMAALKAVGCPVEDGDLHLFNPKWGYDIVRAANQLHVLRPFESMRAFWISLPNCFWKNISVSDIMLPLLDTCRDAVGAERMCVLTSPVEYCHDVSTLKISWMDGHLPFWMHERYIISKHKHFCAHPEALLIDDCEANVYMFCKHGGHAILVPRPWNSLHANTPDALQYVLLELERIL